MQLLTLLPWYLNVNGRVGGSWPGAVVDIVTLVPQCEWSGRRE